MGTVVQLKNRINNSYSELKSSVEDKLILVEEKIKTKLSSKVDLVEEMTKYHLRTGGKKLRALLTLGSARLCGYSKGSRDINLAACVEMIHAATLMHDDVIDKGEIRRGKKTLNSIWGNHSSTMYPDLSYVKVDGQKLNVQIDNEEFISETVSVAVPILDKDSRYLASLFVNAPTIRVSLEALQTHVPRLRVAAQDIQTLCYEFEMN